SRAARATGAGRRAGASRARLRGPRRRAALGFLAGGRRRTVGHHVARHPRGAGRGRRAGTCRRRARLRGLGRGPAGIRDRREQLAHRAGAPRDPVLAAARPALAGRRWRHRRGHDAHGRARGPRMSAGAIRADGTVLGFDVGARRIGVAIGSPYGAGARALAVVDVHDGRVDWPAIDRLHREWRPEARVAGDPRTLDGGDQPIRARARAFAAELKARYRLPVAMVDERSSSIEAAQRFAAERAEGRRRRRDAAALDAVAAAVIVERWFAAPGDATLL